MEFSTIIDDIDNAVSSSEIDVLIAIGESYQKLLDMMEYTDLDESIIQETCLFMEADDSNTNNDSKSSIKAVFNKIIDFIKTAFSKISDIFRKKFIKNKESMTIVANMFTIMDSVKHVKQPKPTKESYYGDEDDEVVQEGLFNKTPQEKLADQARKNIKAENKQKATEEKKLSKEKAKLNKALSKEYKSAIRKRQLTKNDIKAISEHIANVLTPEEFKNLQNAISQFEKGQLERISKDTIKNVLLIDTLSKHLMEINEVADRILKPGYISGHSDNVRYLNKKDMKVVENINKQTEKSSRVKVEKDLKLMRKFAETLGKELNELSKTDNFSYENLKRMMYGGNTFGTMLASTANCLWNIGKRAPKLVTDLSKHGEKLYIAHHMLDDYMIEDDALRKELGVELNKTMKILKTVVLDNIKEETYGWQDDEAFNDKSYRDQNLTTLCLGGPITLSFKLIMLAITRDPSALGVPGDVGPVDLALMGVARSLNPTGVKWKDIQGNGATS